VLLRHLERHNAVELHDRPSRKEKQREASKLPDFNNFPFPRPLLYSPSFYSRMLIKKLQANYSELHPNRNKHMTVDNVLALNANAVHLLSSDGNAQGAINVLREALMALRQMILVPIDTGPDHVREYYKLRTVSAKLDDFSSSFRDDNSFHLFGRAILVERCGKTLAPYDRLLNRISMVVTYNLGLAHHLLGTQNGNNQRRNYTKALTFYEVVYTLKKVCADNRDIVYLAVFNNMGHIYSHFFDKQSTHRCLEAMHSVLKSGSRNEDRACEEYYPFFMNILMYYMQEAVATPAA
jgi:hypothetical protein